MRQNKVGSVMATEVVTARYGTPFKEVVRLLTEHRISGLPVIDEDDKVLGVISETDLMVRQAGAPDPYETPRRFRFTGLTRGARRQAAKGRARTAGQLMSVPPVTGVRAHVTFGGCLEEGAKGFVARRIVSSGKGGDFRDFGQIEAWATDLGTELVSGMRSD
ncbi:CBS domain-containing protein [Streptomyces mirabilis]|uniref:CBS domain-containing protein n=1 Tax=Streptomyces mirabilis TaxID=68239 RepID=UPI003685072F